MTATPPVIFIIFNRADTTKRVFEAIRAAKPPKLLVVADGPRPDKAGENEQCAATRSIVDDVDWDCEVLKNFSDENMGPGLRVSSGIEWGLELADKAIILEDDCLPCESFFPYCAELLERYENDDRIMLVSGQNHLFGRSQTAESYYFSRYPRVLWGWATWKRAWAKYDYNMTRWPEIRRRKLFDQYFLTTRERYYWESIFEAVYNGRIDTADYQWFYSVWANSGLCVTPAHNMVRNIGLRSDAAHTRTKYDKVYDLLTATDVEFPLTHPELVLANSDKDQLESKLRFKLHTRGLLGAYFNYLALEVLVKRTAGRLKNK